MNTEASSGNGAFGTRGFAPDNRHFLHYHASADTPGELYVADTNSGTSRALTRLSMASLDSERLPKSTIVTYRSFDETAISAIVTMPFNLQRDGTHPAIVIPHGGPTSQAKDYFSKAATFAAGAQWFGIINWHTMWTAGDASLREYQRTLVGDPEKDAALYAEQSPMTYLSQAKGPPAVPPRRKRHPRAPRTGPGSGGPAHERRRHGDNFYPEEGHGFYKRENQIDSLERTVVWFDRLSTSRARSSAVVSTSRRSVVVSHLTAITLRNSAVRKSAAEAVLLECGWTTPSSITSTGTRPSGLYWQMRSNSAPTDQLPCSNASPRRFIEIATRRTYGESNIPMSNMIQTLGRCDSL